jgi:hypothetical protein
MPVMSGERIVIGLSHVRAYRPMLDLKAVDLPRDLCLHVGGLVCSHFWKEGHTKFESWGPMGDTGQQGEHSVALKYQESI